MWSFGFSIVDGAFKAGRTAAVAIKDLHRLVFFFEQCVLSKYGTRCAGFWFQRYETNLTAHSVFSRGLGAVAWAEGHAPLLRLPSFLRMPMCWFLSVAGAGRLGVSLTFLLSENRRMRILLETEGRTKLSGGKLPLPLYRVEVYLHLSLQSES